MIGFREYLSEQNRSEVHGDALMSHSAKYDIVIADYTMTKVSQLGWGSPKLTQSDMPYYIGTIGYRSGGREIGYELFELNDYDKAEFGSQNVFMVSSEKMIHQVRTIVKIKGNKIYFIDDDAYLDGEIKFQGRGVDLVRIRLKNEKYNKLIVDMVK